MNLGKFFAVRGFSVAVAILGCLALDYAAQTYLQDYIVRLVFLAGIYITLAVSLNLINGITGQFSIGHAAFYMVGAYTGGTLTKFFYDASPLGAVAWLIAMILAGAALAGVAGLLVGLPSLRLRGDYLAIVTLGFGEIIRIIVINQPELGGSSGLGFAPKVQGLWLVWLLAVICVAVCRNLLKTSHGLAFLAVREDEVAAQAMGINLTKTKVTAFVIGAAFAGAAGALLAMNEGYINPDLFKMDVSFLILTMVVLGGAGSITGSVLAALTLFAIPELPRLLKIDVSLAYLIGLTAGAIAFVSLLRHHQQRYHGPTAKGRMITVATVVGVPLAGLGLGWLLHTFTYLSDQTYELNNLRYVILAVTLIVVMLLRPEGVMGHHEFSWKWVQKVLTGRKPVAEESIS